VPEAPNDVRTARARVTAQRVAVLSDLHLGPSGAALAGRPNAALMGRLVRRLRETHDLLVVNGDLFDLDRSTWPLDHARTYRNALVAHHEILAQMRGADVLWTIGNHDAWLEAGIGAKRAVDVAMPAGVVRIEHGHRFDAPIKRLRTFTSLVTWASGHAAQGAPRLYRWMRATERRLITRHDAGCPIERGARHWLAGHPSYAMMVIGHTHRPACLDVGGRYVLNPGDAMHENIGVVSIDGRTGSFEIVCVHASGDESTLANGTWGSGARAPVPFDLVPFNHVND